MRDAHHPVWILARWVALLVFLVVFSWLNASEFDETEAKMITAVLAAHGLAEAAIWRAARGRDDP